MHGLGYKGNASCACPTETDRYGRGDGLDLEIGTVDELLVGEFVDREQDKGGKTLRCFLPLAFPLSTLLLTNNNLGIYLFLQSFHDFQI